MERENIFRLIEEERDRQDKLHPLPKRRKTDSLEAEAILNIIFCNEFLAILVEEIGEVARALQGEGDLKEELVQTASVCVRWLEQIK
jgi:hypothetical protein